MSNFSALFGGAGGGAPYSIFVAESSGSFTTPVAGTYRITAIGGGGGGSVNSKGGGGGGAGGLAQNIVKLPAGVVISYTVGAGGLQDAAGGNTTVSAPDMTTLTANGGESGATRAGGTASGGNSLNVTGGFGGTGRGTNGGGGGGGGAVGVAGVAFNGANAPGVQGGGGAGTGSSAAGNTGGASLLSRVGAPVPPFALSSQTGGNGGVSTPGASGGVFCGGGGGLGGANGQGGGSGGAYGGGGGGGGGSSGDSAGSAGDGGVGGVFIEWYAN